MMGTRQSDDGCGVLNNLPSSHAKHSKTEMNRNGNKIIGLGSEKVNWNGNETIGLELKKVDWNGNERIGMEM